MNIIIQNAQEAYQILREEGSELWRALLWPALVIVGAGLIPSGPGSSWLLELLKILALGLAPAYIAVRVHRHILSPGGPSLGLLKAIVIYAVLALLVSTAPFIPFIVFSVFPVGFLQLLALPFAAYLAARLSLLLPDVALGNRTPFAEAWRWSHNNGWKLAGALFVPVLPLYLVIALLGVLLGEPTGRIFAGLASIPLLVYGVALLSCAYRSLRSA